MDYNKASEYWDEKDKNGKKIDNSILLAEAEKYIDSHNTCALATGFGDFVRSTPIEYTYIGKHFYMMTEGGKKFVALKENKNVSISVFDEYTGFGKLLGIQISGTAKMIEPFSDEYNEFLSAKNIPLSALKKLDHPMYLIKITPQNGVFLNSKFKSDGFDSRQVVIFNK